MSGGTAGCAITALGECMNIRAAHAGDIDRCVQLDGSYATNYIWQMEESISSEGMDYTFRRVRLPRSLAVDYPEPREALLEDWRRKECFLVAQERGRVVAFLDMTVQRTRWRGWIQHLIVEPSCRRRGIATLLLDAAEVWAQGSELNSVTVVLQSKNDPSITLFAKRHYIFQGFIDHYFNNGDIGFIYSLSF